MESQPDASVSIGKAIANTQIYILDDNQLPVPIGVEGEIAIAGEGLAFGYHGMVDLTREKFIANPINQGERIYRTGDLGRMDKDGYVFITGRLKELIIKGGENIAPREVDEALYAHPDVIEAAAFACSCKRYGQRIEAGVALTAGSGVCEQDLIKLCNSKIGAFKSPDRIHFMDELPKGPSGKIQRIKLQEIFDT